jgi:phosphate:Na+ symporter
MRDAAVAASRAAALCAADGISASSGAPDETPEPSEPDSSAASTGEALANLERCAQALGELRGAYRHTILSAVATGALTADQAVTRVDKVRNLEALAYHAWRSAAYLANRGDTESAR